MNQFTSMLLLFSFFFAGVLVGFSKLLPKSWNKAVGFAIVVTLYLLLFSMGVRTALIENIESQIAKIGLVAFLYALGAVLFCGGGVVLITLLRRRGERAHMRKRNNSTVKMQQNHQGTALRNRLAILQEPLQMIGVVLVGFSLQRFTGWFGWVTSWTFLGQDSTTLILFGMLFFVGLNLVLEDISLLQSMKDFEVLVLPLLTVIFSLLSGLVLNQFLSHTIQESLAISAGLGWYSFSGVFLAEAGNPILGSTAFLANLFRELLSVLLIPLLGALGFPYAAITTAGATSMDVTLPIVEHSCGDTYTPVSLYHGVVITVIIPLLVPLVYGFG